MKLTEEKIINILTKNTTFKDQFSLDDVSSVKSSKTTLITSSDMLVESTDIPPTMTLIQASRKAIIMSVSDFASKGVTPQHCLISIGIPKKYSKNQIQQIAKGLQKGLKEYKISLIGGDTNSSKELIIDCTLMGFSNYKIPSRQTAQNNDIIYAIGKFGLTGTGLFLLKKKKKPINQFERNAIKSVLYPTVTLDAFIKLARQNLINSSIDSSDGLCLSLYQLAEQSKKTFQIDHLPIPKGLAEFAARHDRCINDLILYSGEEYQQVFTVKPSNSKKVENTLKRHKITFTKLGTVKPGKPNVYYKNKLLKRNGWDSFK